MRKAQQRRKQSGAMEKEKTGMLSNAVLKNIAYITMFIDHFFAVLHIGAAAADGGICGRE